MLMRAIARLLVPTILTIASPLARAEEWPKWLGPKGDSISHEAISQHWPDAGPAKVWEQKVGYGFSSPIGFDGKVYLFTQINDQDTLRAFDAATGKPVWAVAYACTVLVDQANAKNPESGFPLPLATPTIDNGHIYTYGGGGDLVSRKIEDGSEVWHTRILKELDEQILLWNQASSPLVTEKLIYVQGGRGGPTAVAVDKASGKIVWKSEATAVGGYTAPLIIDAQGTKQLIVFAGDTLFAMNPDSGKTIWSLPWKTSYQVNASTPNYRDGKMFVSSAYGYGSAMLSITPTGVSVDWKSKELQQKFQPSILDGDYLYMNSNGILKCFHWPDGKIAWSSTDSRLKLEEGGTIVRDGDKLIALSARGKLNLVEATPVGVKLISQVKLFDFLTTWSTPLIYRGKLYAMGEDSLICLDISSPVTLR
jgi:outer membrane protein assembly factor BamB